MKVINIVSDIGRTNRYNEKGGKDHWSTTSSIIMANNPSWGNRVVGETDDGHYAQKINFNSMKSTGSTADMTVSPNKVQAALRQYMAIDTHETSNDFSLAESTFIPKLF